MDRRLPQGVDRPPDQTKLIRAVQAGHRSIQLAPPDRLDSASHPSQRTQRPANAKPQHKPGEHSDHKPRQRPTLQRAGNDRVGLPRRQPHKQDADLFASLVAERLINCKMRNAQDSGLTPVGAALPNNRVVSGAVGKGRPNRALAVGHSDTGRHPRLPSKDRRGPVGGARDTVDQLVETVHSPPTKQQRAILGHTPVCALLLQPRPKHSNVCLQLMLCARFNRVGNNVQRPRLHPSNAERKHQQADDHQPRNKAEPNTPQSHSEPFNDDGSCWHAKINKLLPAHYLLLTKLKNSELTEM